jgi:hypothetical protein
VHAAAVVVMQMVVMVGGRVAQGLRPRQGVAARWQIIC